MTRPAERAAFAKGIAVIPRGFEEEMASRLPGSLREEAIWQFQTGGKRGVIAWGADQTFRYLNAEEWQAFLHAIDGLRHAPKVLERYDPMTEALLATTDVESLRILRIIPGGRWILVREEPLAMQMDLRCRTESEKKPETRSDLVHPTAVR